MFLWRKGVRADLNSLVSGVILAEAVAINDRGQIAANLADTEINIYNYVRAVLLTPH